jgi:hypothetical protein
MTWEEIHVVERRFDVIHQGAYLLPSGKGAIHVFQKPSHVLVGLVNGIMVSGNIDAGRFLPNAHDDNRYLLISVEDKLCSGQ